MNRGRLLGTWVLSVFLFSAAADAAEAPSVFHDAVAWWSMGNAEGSGRMPSQLSLAGDVEVGVKLEGEDSQASLARGGDGQVARFRGGYLTANSATPIRLDGQNASICVRLRDASSAWKSPVFSLADSQDPLSGVIFGTGTDLVYRWRTSPPWDRVEGIRKPQGGAAAESEQGSYGFNGEANDAHDLLPYSANHWICSVVTVHDNGRVFVADQFGSQQGGIDIERQAVSNEAFYVGCKSGGGEFLDGEVCEILVYDRTLSDEESRQVVSGLLAKWRITSEASAAVYHSRRRPGSAPGREPRTV